MASNRKGKRRALPVIIGVVVFLGAGAVLARSMGWISSGEVGVPVETAEAERKTITQLVSASGKIQPEVEVILRPEVSGEIIELPVKEGDYVLKGELLLRIKPDIYQARIDEINASLLTQKARLEQARASLLEAESVFRQKDQLFRRDAISEAEHVQAQTALDVQKANFKASEYQVQSIEAQLEQAREELQKTIIRSPREGTISHLAVEVGERVLGNTQSIGTELMRIAKMDQMEVLVQVNENDIVNVTVGDTANIELDAYPERVFRGMVTEIANSAEVSGTGTAEQVTNYEVKVRVTTPHNLDRTGGTDFARRQSPEVPEGEPSPDFKPGMSATVDVEANTVYHVTAVPIQAVTVRNFSGDNQSTPDSVTTEGGDPAEPGEELRKVVFVVNDNIVARREVETGISDNTHIQLLSGVEEGEQIVIGSYRILSQELEDGDKVSVNNSNFLTVASSNP